MYAPKSVIGDQTVPAVNDQTIYIDIQITEPILLSPFVFGSPENKAGFYGITNMNFQMNMAANANRAWRSVRFDNGAGTVLKKNATVERFSSSALTFIFFNRSPYRSTAIKKHCSIL